MAEPKPAAGGESRLVLHLFNTGHRTSEEIKLALLETDEWRTLRRG